MGDPVPKDGVGARPHQWRVPYDVADDAGNKAKTVWRDVIVEEVDIEDFERMAVQDEARSPNGDEDRSVTLASSKERRRSEASPQQVCPPCDPCKCNINQQKHHGGSNGGGDGMLSSVKCAAMCNDKIAAAEMARTSDKTCAPTFREGGSDTFDHRIVQVLLVFLEGMMGPSAMMLLFLGCFIATVVYVVQRAIAALFISSGPHTRTYYHTQDDDERERAMMRNVSYYRSPTPSSSSENRQSTGSASGPRFPPTGSMSLHRNGIFSMQENRVNGTPLQMQQQQGRANSSPFRSNDGTDNIYQSASPITPMRKDIPSPVSQGR